jgi:hypothetical protein
MLDCCYVQRYGWRKVNLMLCLSAETRAEMNIIKHKDRGNVDSRISSM